MTDGPSIAALIVPWDPASALGNVGRALAKRGMSPHKTPLPVGYKPSPSEWVGAVSLPLPGLRRGREHFANAAVVPSDVARIFDLALWVSAAFPDDVFVAWRRFSGMEPVAKVLWGGKPRWKNGADADHEVSFDVPQGIFAEARPPSEPKVPLDVDQITIQLLAIVKPLKDPLAVGGAAWLHSSSMLR